MEVNNKVYNVSNINDINTVDKNQSLRNYKENNSSNIKIEKTGISKEGLDKLIEEANNKFRVINKEFSYELHEDTNRISVKIKDSETGKIISEIPSEESLDLSAKIKEMVGLLIDKKS